MVPNIHRIEGDVTYITLTKGQEAIIDTSDLEHVLQLRWQAECLPSERYYARSRSLGKSITMHQHIIKDASPEENMVISHINGNMLDNRRENLKWITASERSSKRNNKPGKTGLRYINIIAKDDGYKEYYVSMMRKGVKKAKAYPYTEDGLQAAKDLVVKWQEDFSYEPERTTQSQRRRRANLHTATSVGTGPHVNYVPPVEEETHPNLDNAVLIPLNKGQYAIVDREDADKANKYAWFASPNMMGSYYAIRRTETGGSVYLHRYLLDAPNDMVVDHINHNTLDNRRENLKLCTNQENNENRDGAYSTSRTGIRGVSVHKLKKSNGLMYIFRCQCINCKAAKYFPYTEEGLEAARVFAEAHYAAMKNK